MAKENAAAGNPQKKDRARNIGTFIAWTIVVLVCIWGYHALNGGSGHGYQPVGGPSSVYVAPAALTLAVNQPPVTGMPKAVSKQYIDINPNTFVGVDVNAYLGGGKYFHWQLEDVDVTMDVMMNGNLIGREYARRDPRWTPLRQTTAANRLDFRMTPGDRGTLKTTARVCVWYDDSPTDELGR